MNSLDAITVESPLGTLILSATNKGLAQINYPVNDEDERTVSPRETSTNPHLENAIGELGLYFEGKLECFTTALDPKGTPFQLSVWNELSKIPYGETASYGDIAERIGNPGGSQAIGMANNRNPISIIIPCHRVIGRDGKLIGYGGGIWRKEWLLKHEGMLLG